MHVLKCGFNAISAMRKNPSIQRFKQLQSTEATSSQLIQIKLLTDKNDILEARFMDINSKHNEFVMKYEDLETKHSIAIEQLQLELTNKYESQINELSSHLTSFQSSYDTLQIKHQQLQQQTTNLQSRNTSLHNEIHQQDEDVNLLNQQLIDTRINLQSQLREYQLSCNAQSILIDDLKHQLNIANTTQRRRSSANSVLRKDLNRTLQVHFNKTPSDRQSVQDITFTANKSHTLLVSHTPPKLSLVSTSALSVEFCLVDNGAASEVSVMPSPTCPSCPSCPSLGNHNSNTAQKTPRLTRRRFAARSEYTWKHSLNYGGSGQMSAKSYSEPLISSQTELAMLSIDIEEDELEM